MTATPTREGGRRFGLDQDDYQNEYLRHRLFAAKPARMVDSKARPRDLAKLAHRLVQEALALSREPGLRRIAVMVNRVRTARLIYQALKQNARSLLLIGRMRPVDRLKLEPELEAMLSGKPRSGDGEVVFVVATQCLEVGADLDFDGLITECASIDALLQRFGRLDRIGDLKKSGVTAKARVVGGTDEKNADAVYGESLAQTWKWLQRLGEEVNFGICSEDGKSTVRERLQEDSAAEGMRLEAPLAPALLPMHLDALVQTSPRPALEPDVRLFLHGREHGSPDVQVVWRADLDIARPEHWAEIVALCPPVSIEAMTVPLRDFRAWLTDRWDQGAFSSDIEGEEIESTDDEAGRPPCPVLRWRGCESDLVASARDLRPGDTLILACSSGGWEELGHIPEGADVDLAERARSAMRGSGSCGCILH